jgi:hypothetical protein
VTGQRGRKGGEESMIKIGKEENIKFKKRGMREEAGTREG